MDVDLGVCVLTEIFGIYFLIGDFPMGSCLARHNKQSQQIDELMSTSKLFCPRLTEAPLSQRVHRHRFLGTRFHHLVVRRQLALGKIVPKGIIQPPTLLDRQDATGVPAPDRLRTR